MKNMFREIWREKFGDNIGYCEVCGHPIREPRVHNFSHIYSRGARPDLRYDKRNIQVWCSSLDRDKGCHTLWHNQPHRFWERAREHGWEKPEL